MTVSKVIVSCDDYFAPFRHIVRKAWKKFFPEIVVDVCYVGNNNIDEDNTYNYPLIDNVPIGNLGKVLRLYHASQQGDIVCSIHDIDTIPLQRKYLEQLLSARNPEHLCLVGGEYYVGTPDFGKTPMVPTTAEGNVFSNLFKIDSNLNWQKFVSNNLYVNGAYRNESLLSAKFSDESLLKFYLDTFKGNIQRLRRDQFRELNPHIHWIDRTLRGFSFDKDRLFNGFYTECNMERPYNPTRLDLIEQYLS